MSRFLILLFVIFQATPSQASSCKETFKDKEVEELKERIWRDYKDKNLQTYLQFNDLNYVEARLKKGINPNEQNEYGYTALHFTTNKKVAQVLLRAGADPDIQNNFGKTPSQEHIDRQEHLYLVWAKKEKFAGKLGKAHHKMGWYLIDVAIARRGSGLYWY